MAYFMSYWSHLDISMTICPHQMAAVGLELTTLGFKGMAPYALCHRCGQKRGTLINTTNTHTPALMSFKGE